MERIIRRETLLLCVLGAILVVFFSTSVALAVSTVTRTVNVHFVPVEPITVAPNVDQNITVSSPGIDSVTYSVCNVSEETWSVLCGWECAGGLPSGVDVAMDLDVITLDPGQCQDVTVVVSGDEFASDCAIQVHFTPTQEAQ